jgi:hypothetical protein
MKFMLRHKKLGAPRTIFYILSGAFLYCLGLVKDVTISVCPANIKRTYTQPRKDIGVKVQGKLLEYLQDEYCIGCKENNPTILDFNHTEPKTKFKLIVRTLAGH